MIVDHVGLFFFPQALWMRALGRLAYPLFAWMIVNGAEYTQNVNKYLKRLLLFALISQPFYSLMLFKTGYMEFSPNILFTLALGLLCVIAIKKYQDIGLHYLVITVAMLAANLLKLDYGAMGIISIVFFYIYKDSLLWTVISQSLVYCLLGPILMWLRIYPINEVTLAQPLALAALAIIATYNKKEGKKTGYIFYVLYPLQFVIFYIISTLLY